MGAVLASRLIARVRILMKDRSTVAQRYTDLEYLDMLNEGQLAVARSVPFASLKQVVHTLVAGVSQRIPVDGMLFIRAQSDATGYRVFTPTTVDILDATTPNWRYQLDPDPDLPRQVAIDPNDPMNFYVVPGGLSSILLQYAAVPLDLVNDSSPIAINDLFQTALVYYMAYKATEADSDNANDKALSDLYFQKFNSTVMGATPGVAQQ